MACADPVLLERFVTEIKSQVPHLVEGRAGPTFVNRTPLVDMTDDLIECARTQYGLDISGKSLKILGKLESRVLGGSIKIRPAVQIIGDAITSGRLREKMTVFEATSGNFGIALGLLRRLDLDVVALVSRRLGDGVLNELKKAGVKTINLDIDVCPAPGRSVDTASVVARATASRVGEQLSHLGFDASVFEDSRAEIERMLARGDSISLAKLLARAYGGFCPEQYDNESNAKSHEVLTGPELEQQLRELGSSLGEFKIVCTFGSGGTSAGLSEYVRKKFGRKSVLVVFPLSNQDVAGIRSKEKSIGLRFYEPEKYAGQLEVDFVAAKRALGFFSKKGYDIGESSALAIYATLLMITRGVDERFVVILADGIKKYRESSVEPEVEKRLEVTGQEASSNAADFGEVLWTHPLFLPSEEGVGLLSSSLGCGNGKVRVAPTGDVEALYFRQEITEGLRKLLPNDGEKVLLVCTNGRTSLTLARLLSEKGVDAVSLKGGLSALSGNMVERATELLELAET